VALTEVNILSEKITTIPSSLFSGCSELENITIPYGVKTIESGAFSGCTVLENVTFPDTLESIGMRAFSNCWYVKEIRFNEGLLNVESFAFEKCSLIKEIYIPSSIESIGEAAFSLCASLKSIRVSDDNMYYKSDSGVLYTKDGKYLVQYPIGALNESFEVPFGVEEVCQYAFSAANELRDVIFPSSIRKIGDYAFNSMRSLMSVAFTEGIESIGYKSFAYTNLQAVIIPNTVKNVGMHAFDGCTGMKNAVLGSGMTEIANGMFNKCRNLESVYIPNTILNISTEAFNGCTALNNVVIPNSVKTIGSKAFYECKSIKSLEVGSGVTNIYEEAFRGCNIEKVYIADISAWCNIGFDESYSNPLMYSEYLYIGGDLVSQLVIPDNVTQIRKYAFYLCGAIESVVIGSGVTKIERSAFASNNNLVSIKLKTTPTIEEYAFSSCDKLVEIICPKPSVYTLSSSNNGSIALNAKLIHSGPETKIVRDGDYGFLSVGGVNYLVAYYGNNHELVLPESYMGGSYIISSYVFFKMPEITKVTLSSGVKSIEKNAFAYNENLESVVIPSGVESIGERAFYQCNRLYDITISEGLVKIEDYAFASCLSLETIVIPSTVKYIGRYAFSASSNLKYATFVMYSGWWYTTSATATYGSAINSSDLNNAEIAAKYLRNTYCGKYWKHN